MFGVRYGCECNVLRDGGDPLHSYILIMHLSILRPTTPHTGHRWGLVVINRDLHVNFDPRGGAFDLSPHNLCHEVRRKFWCLGGLERTRVVTFIGGRKELYTEILSKFSDVFRGEEVARSVTSV